MKSRIISPRLHLSISSRPSVVCKSSIDLEHISVIHPPCKQKVEIKAVLTPTHIGNKDDLVVQGWCDCMREKQGHSYVRLGYSHISQRRRGLSKKHFQVLCPVCYCEIALERIELGFSEEEGGGFVRFSGICYRLIERKPDIRCCMKPVELTYKRQRVSSPSPMGFYPSGEYEVT